MSNEIKAGLIVAATVVILIGMAVLGGQGCDRRSSARTEVEIRSNNDFMSKCVQSGKAPLECAGALKLLRTWR